MSLCFSEFSLLAIASWIVIAAFKALIEGSSVGRDGQTIVYRGWGQA
jgi:hypothetical protein